jgi:hypothetical protein
MENKTRESMIKKTEEGTQDTCSGYNRILNVRRENERKDDKVITLILPGSAVTVRMYLAHSLALSTSPSSSIPRSKPSTNFVQGPMILGTITK